jgi:hypothetical protein
MKSFKVFIEFNKRNCIKNNLITSSIFIALAVVFILGFIISIAGMQDSALGPIYWLLLLGVSIVYMIFPIVIPLFIRVYSNFKYNLTSLIGIWLCSLTGALRLLHSNNDYKGFAGLMLFYIFCPVPALFLKYFVVKKCTKV